MTVQVIDPQDRESRDTFILEVWIAATATGGPSSAGHSVSITTGTALQVVTANALYRIITDTLGKAVFTLTAGAPPITRYVRAAVERTAQTGAATIA